MFKRLSFIFLILILSGCSNSKRGVQSEKIARLNFSREIDSLDPRRSNDETSANLLNMLYEGLMRVDLEGHAAPALAKSYTVSSDNLTYTFHLRDAVWSDGSPITAYDFEYSWKKMLSPDFDTTTKGRLFILKNARKAALGDLSIDEVGVHALNKKTLKVELEHPAEYFIDSLATWYYFPVRAGIDEANPSWRHDFSSQFFSGPFAMHAYKHNDVVLLEKNLRYWDEENVHLDAIEINMIADAHTELEMFEHGQLDFAGQPLSLGLPIDSLEPLQKSGLLKMGNPSKLYLYLFNTKEPPFDNKSIRLAFSYAVNREQIIDFVAQGGQEPALSFVPPMFSNVKRPLFKDGDLSLAKKHFEKGLKESGYSRENFPKITINSYPSPVQEKVVQTIAQQWEQAFGIPIYIEQTQWSVHLDKLTSRNYQVLCINWFPELRDSITFLNAFAPFQGNFTNWNNPRYDEIWALADREADSAVRSELLAEAENLLVKEMPAIPLYYNGPAYLINDKLKNVHIGDLGVIEFKWADLMPERDAL